MTHVIPPTSRTGPEHGEHNLPDHGVVEVRNHAVLLRLGPPPNSQTEPPPETFETHNQRAKIQPIFVALHSKEDESKKSDKSDIFQYRTTGGKPRTRGDIEKTVPDGPSSWLDNGLETNAKVAEFRIDPRGNFDAAALFIRGRVERSPDMIPGRTSIVFFIHGCGGMVLQKILQLGQPLEFMKSVAAVINFASPLTSVDVVQVEEWARQDLKPGRGSLSIPDAPFRETKSFLTENDIPLVEYWDRPFSNKPFDTKIAWRTDLTTTAEIHDNVAIQFRNLRRIVQKLLSEHRVFIAARHCSKSLIETLMDEGRDIKVTTPRGRNALHLAIQEESLEVFEALIACHLSKRFIKQRDLQGNTALHIAIKLLDKQIDDTKIKKMVQGLLDNGASRTVKNSEGLTPLTLAAERVAIKEMLIQPQLIGRQRVPVLVKGKLPKGEALEACNKTYITVTTVLSAKDKLVVQPEEVIQVRELLYGESPLSELLNLPQGPVVPNYHWYHIPTNNMAWLNDLVYRLGLKTWPWPSSTNANHLLQSRRMLPQCTRLGYPADESSITAIMMPYISYESYNHYLQYRKTMKDAEKAHKVENGTTTDEPPCNTEEPQLKLEEESTILGYMYHPEDLFLHPRQTLDQSHYYMIEDTAYRDGTQVVDRVARWNHSRSGQLNRPEVKSPHNSEHNILMVDQLWLWKIPKGLDIVSDTIVTCFPTRHEASTGIVDDIRDRVILESAENHIREVDNLIDRILSACTDIFEPNDIESLRFFTFFESEIGRAEEQLHQHFRRFQYNVDSLYSLREDHTDYREIRDKSLKGMLNIREETELLHEIKDVLDEVNMIQDVLESQSSIKASTESILGPDTLPEFSSQLVAAKAKFSHIAETAKSVEKGITDLLDLKQKQANLWEARSSREGAEQTAKQGKTILMFTVVTIIFLPLSFMAAFLAISIDRFPRNQQDDVKWPVGKLCGLLFGISVALIIPLLLSAFKIQRIESQWEATKTLRTKAMLTMLRKFWKVARLRSDSSKLKERIHWSTGIIDRGIRLLVSWYCNLLKELIIASTSTFQEGIQRHVDHATDFNIVYKLTFLADFDEGVRGEYIRAIHSLSEEYDKQRKRLGSEELHSKHGGGTADGMAELQAADIQRIISILQGYGFPITADDKVD